MPIFVIGNDEQFQNKLTAAGGNLVVVDFTASWFVLKDSKSS